MRSIRPLTQLMTKLKVLTIENIVRERLSDLSKEMNYYKVKNVLKLITNNKNNLVKLDIDEVLLWYYPKINSLQTRAITSHTFPHLKSLRIRTHQRDHTEMNQQNLITFLHGHANLEELDITITPRFPNVVLHALHSLTHLRRLCIKTKRFEHEELDLWSFLSRLTALQTLRIIVSRSFGYGQNSGSPVDILIALPKSVQEISLKGFPKPGFHNLDLSPSTSLRDVLQFDSMNVTTLKLKNCRSFVNDNLLKLIFTFFKMLRLLDLSFNESITDFGLTGLTESDDSVSKHSLKDLKGTL
ncbi:unnamed protein product [Allacma fusca]|uniref:Uncharacterized protein n=1 Tax=Allacma fusca TaxID=39272 RepID=A0A8J2PKK2_9HEXA|nr:unnamed protein product [Allacma fusca]